MKGHVKSVLLTGPQAICSSQLFQAAMHWSELGTRVLYISTKSFSKLPIPIHGASAPKSDTFKQIRFMYLPTWQELLQYLYTLHTHAQIPGVILVEGLDHYCKKDSVPTDKHGNEQESVELHTSLIAASLIDAASVCVKNPERPAQLIATWESDLASILLHPLDLFFSTIWCVSSLSDDRMQITSVNSLGESTKIRLEFKKTENCIIFDKILKISKVNKIDSAVETSLSENQVLLLR